MCEKRGNTLHLVPSIGFQCFSQLLRRKGRIAVIVLVIRYMTGQPLKVGAKIGNDNYVYMLWRYNDCCVRYIPALDF